MEETLEWDQNGLLTIVSEREAAFWVWVLRVLVVCEKESSRRAYGGVNEGGREA